MQQNAVTKHVFILLTLGLFLMPQSAMGTPFEGYTLFSVTGAPPATTYLIDNDFNHIQTWTHDNGPASMPYLIPGDVMGLENTHLIYPYRVANPTMDFEGVGGGVQCLDWDGNVLWEYELSNHNYQHHHDVEPLPNGNVLMIAWEKRTLNEAEAAGRTVINNPLNQMWSFAIFEVGPDDNGDVVVHWEWHLWDHLIQDADAADENYGVVADHPELFDINLGDVGTASGPGGANADWMHVNSIAYRADVDQIVFSARNHDEIFVIDHSTTTEEAAGHSGGNSGKGGDFLYRWGNPQNYDRGGEEDHILDYQHGINWIPAGSPGEGHFLLFNNYHDTTVSPHLGAALEFVPPMDENGNYTLIDGQPYGPESYTWESPADYPTFMQGGAFRLPNGNTLITDADSALIEEITENGTVVWSYEAAGSNSMIARAQKYSLDHFACHSYLGDLNGDNDYDVLDIVPLANCVLAANCAEMTYACAADLNGDDVYNVLDIVPLANCVLAGNCGP
jgi:hypothetical protein